MPRSGDLAVQGRAAAEQGDQGNDQGDEDISHGGHRSHAVAAAGRPRQRPPCPCCCAPRRPTVWDASR